MTPAESSRSVVAQTKAIASGDPEAFACFYDEWFDRALAEARRCSRRDDEFCLDVVQDAMMRVIKSLKPLPSEAALYQWMRVVIRSCVYDRLRADIRRRKREFETSIKESADSTDSPEEQLTWLHEQLLLLDEPEVHLLVMRHRFGWTLQKIGRVLGLSHGTIDRRLRRVVGKLRKNAKEDFHGFSTW